MLNKFIIQIIDYRKLFDLVLIVIAGLVGYSLDHGSPSILMLAPLAFLKMTALFYSGTYNRFWRYTSLNDLKVTLSCLATAEIIGIPVLYFSGLSISSSILVSLLTLCSITFVRILKRYRFEEISEKEIKQNGKRTLIYGQNKQAQLFINRARNDKTLELCPVAVLDKDAKKIGTTIEGIDIVGTIENLQDICIRFKIQEIVVADHNIDGDNLAFIHKIARNYNIRPRLLSGTGLESWETKKYELFKDVNIDDLLSRDKVNVDTSLIASTITDKCILVTGAGGSIGSELCRQLIAMNPSKLLIADHSEFNLYTIHKELTDRWPTLQHKVVPLLVDVKEKKNVELIFLNNPIQIVYHAAAYKHVHLVEMNPLISIRNNILGTKIIIEVSQASSSLEKFVLVSTDKAVNPTSIMGATKRICELMVTAAALKTNKKFCSVRFGNVLGSSGSFIPLLKQQVRNGGPVTVTDPRMERFFMTIPEAVSLVLEASRISSPGDINVLKMGESLKILDIVKKMITLMGRTEEEIAIVFTGIRPGEKLFEELYLCGDECQTHHKDIVVLPKGDAFSPATDLLRLMEQIEFICMLALQNNTEAVVHLKKLVEEHKRDRKTTEVAA